jgi:catechol 2,3-dioxygenase-like lactoylglutathione lyase family enzyme
MSTVKRVLKDYIIGLAHVGYIVEDMDKALANFKRVYGVTDSDIRIPADPPGELQTKFAFVVVHDTEFELIEPVSGYFKKLLFEMPSGLAGINHVAYQVSDIEAAAATLAQLGIRAGHVTPNGVVDFGPKKLIYLDPADTGGLVIELIELKS